MEVPATVAADCSVDVSGPLAKLIAAAPDGRRGHPTVIRLRRRGCYRIDQTLSLRNRNHLVFEGRGATLRWVAKGLRGRRLWRLVGGSGLEFRNLNLVGPSPAPGLYIPELDNQHGFMVLGVAGFSLNEVTVSDVYGDFVYLGSTKGPEKDRRGSSNVVITNSHFSGAGRQGITLSWVDRVTIRGNRLENVARTMIDDEATSRAGGGRDVLVADNDLGYFGHHGYLIHGKGKQRNVRIINNRFRGEVINVWVKSLNARGKVKDRIRRRGIEVSGNVSDVVGYAPVIDIDRTDGVIVRGNHQAGIDSTQWAVRVTRSTGVRVSGNDFPGYRH